MEGGVRVPDVHRGTGAVSVRIGKGTGPGGIPVAVRLGNTSNGGLRSISLALPVNVVAYVANISNSNGSALVGHALVPLTTARLGGTSALVTSGRSDVANLRRLSGVISVSRDPVNHAPHSGPTACANIFAPIHRVFTRARRTHTHNCGTNHFDFGMGNKHYRVYRNSNLVGIRVRFLPSVCIPYSAYRNGHCGHRALRVRCGNGDVTSILSVAIRSTARFFSTVPTVCHHLRTLVSINLNCVHLNRSTPALSNNRTRHIGLTHRLTGHSAKRALCVLSRPAANLRFRSVSGLLRVLRALHSGNGAVIIVRRGLSIVGATS